MENFGTVALVVIGVIALVGLVVSLNGHSSRALTGNPQKHRPSADEPRQPSAISTKRTSDGSSGRSRHYEYESPKSQSGDDMGASATINNVNDTDWSA